VITVGCGRPSNQSDPTASASPITYEVIDVKGVRRGPTPTTLLIDAEVPSGGDDCVRNLRAEVFDKVPGARSSSMSCSTRSTHRCTVPA